MRSRLVAVAAVATLVILAAPALAAASPAKSPTQYYLALGDSLARGAQPNSSGVTVPTNQGYTNDLFAAEQSHFKGLKLKELGCLGETTVTMMKGGICTYPGGSQLAAAVAFLHKHSGHIAFVTIDIGANDIDGCVSGTTLNLPCLKKGIKQIKQNLPKISAALRKAAGASVPIVGMTYYDPFLAAWFEGSSGQMLAAASQTLAKTVNKDIVKAYATAKIKVANVARAFKTYTSLSKGSPVPTAVAEICNLTWMCAPSPQGPNIHANAAGYSTIATTFKKLV